MRKYDTSYQCKNTYINNYNCKSFLASGIADKELDILEIDQELLNATLFFVINNYRLKNRKSNLKYSNALDEIAFNYTQILSRKKFISNGTNNYKIKIWLPKLCKSKGYNGKLRDIHIDNPIAINYKRPQKFYFDRKNKITSSQIYYGKKPKKNDTISAIMPVPAYTYLQFAENALRTHRRNRSFKSLKSKAYTHIGCYIRISSRTIHKRKIPRFKLLIIYGGYSLGLLEEL